MRALLSWMRACGMCTDPGRIADVDDDLSKPDLVGSRVVVIGGGVIGLCTAFQLATLAKVEGRPASDVEILVLEAQPSSFPSASSHNTGCLHYDYPDAFGQDLKPLGQYSFNIWKDIAATDPAFQKATGYRRQSFFWIFHGNGGMHKLPDWVRRRDDWTAKEGESAQDCASINPVHLGEWLEDACRLLGVKIQTSATALEAMISERGTIMGVKYSVRAKETRKEVFLCDKIVLAAGPWTPDQVKKIFPQSTLDLAPATLAGDWLLIKNPLPTRHNSIASVFFNHIVGEKLEYSGRNDGTIWVCGKTNPTALLPRLGEEAHADEQFLARLLEYSRKILRPSSQGDSEIDPIVISRGRSFRPMRKSGLPLITEVPLSCLFADIPRLPSTRQSGVFICYGHGSYGISLGMGSGKLMAQVVRGESPDIDISKFTI